MLERFIEAVLLCAFFSAVGYSVVRILGGVAAGMVEKSGKIDGLRATVARRSGLERNFASRVGDRRKTMAGLDRDIKELTRQRTNLNLTIAELHQTPDRVIRVIGQEVTGAESFLALVFNKYVSPTGGGKAGINPDWATAQEVAVWAGSLAEARGELDRHYPESQGYKVTNLVETPKG